MTEATCGAKPHTTCSCAVGDDGHWRGRRSTHTGLPLGDELLRCTVIYLRRRLERAAPSSPARLSDRPRCCPGMPSSVCCCDAAGAAIVAAVLATVVVRLSVVWLPVVCQDAAAVEHTASWLPVVGPRRRLYSAYRFSMDAGMRRASCVSSRRGLRPCICRKLRSQDCKRHGLV